MYRFKWYGRAAQSRPPDLFAIEDHDQHELSMRDWLRHFYSSLFIFSSVIIFTRAYLYFTPEGSNRDLLTSLANGLLVMSVVLLILPAKAIAASRWRQFFFHVWTSISLLLSFLLVWLDGGVDSPTLLYLYLIMIFVIQTYSWQSALIYALAEVVLYSFVALAHPGSTGFHANHIFVLGLLALSNAWGILVAHNREVRERDNAYYREKLAFMASHDAMTGCLNGRAFRERCQQEITLAHQQNQTLSLLMIDLDNFKTINDAHGHLEGDKALSLVADMLREVARHSDVTGRLGGDEFVLLAPATGQEDVEVLAQRLRHRIEHDATLPCRLTLSIGVCTANCSSEWHYKELLKCADDALYEVKRSGRNGVQMRVLMQ